MSTTSDGYTARTTSAVDAVKSLAQPDAWNGAEGDEWEDARNIIEVTTNACKRASKGKGRVTAK
jgi:hypothetical protein